MGWCHFKVTYLAVSFGFACFCFRVWSLLWQGTSYIIANSCEICCEVEFLVEKVLRHFSGPLGACADCQMVDLETIRFSRDYRELRSLYHPVAASAYRHSGSRYTALNASVL